MVEDGVLRTEAPPWLHARAATHLGALGGPQAVAALQGVLQGGDLRVQASAALSLRKLGQPAPIQDLVVRAGTMAGDPDGTVRTTAVETLGQLGTEASLPYLTQALRDPNSAVRREAGDSLRQTGLPEAMPLLRRALTDPDASVVKTAERAIKHLEHRLRGRGR